MLHPELTVATRPLAAPENQVFYKNLRVTVLEDRLFRLETVPFTDEATQTIWFRDHAPVAFSSRVHNGRLWIQTEALTLEVHAEDLRSSLVHFADGEVSDLYDRDNLLGTLCTLDTNGEHLRLWPEVRQYDRTHIPLEKGVLSRRGVAVYDDSKRLLLYPDGRLSNRAGEGLDLYVFAFGHDYYGALRALYRLCGSAPLLPRWALGNWWSRYWPYTQQEYLELMDDFAEDNIPMAVAVIDMDWHYVDIDGTFHIREQGLSDERYGGTDGWTGYTWNEGLFPDPPGFLAELHRRNLHVALNLHPALGVRFYEKPYAEMARRLGLDPSSRLRIPFQIADDAFVNAYLDVLHHPLEEEGVDFWWIDWQQGDQTALAGLDPLWALNHYHYLDNQNRTGQGLILSRYAGIGSHRYPVGFSGDTHMDWEFLDYMPYFTATASNAGYSWWSHDIGGHHRGERDEELYLRWLQFGVFSPINRMHCCPAAVTSKAPWTLSLPARAVAEKWFRLRHALIPLLFSCNCRTSEEARPLIVPMYYAYPEEAEAYVAHGQYLFAETLLVAPITHPSRQLGMGEVDVWLPEGRWTDCFTGRTYVGDRRLPMLRDSGSIPVLARSGAIIPLDPAPGNGCDLPEKIRVEVFNGDGTFVLREGAHGEYGTRFAIRQGGPNRYCFCVDIPADHPLDVREYEVRFRNAQAGSLVLSVDGQERPVSVRTNRCLHATLSLCAGQSATVELELQPVSEQARLAADMLEVFIRLPQDNQYKELQWAKTASFATVEQWAAWIDGLDVPDVGRQMLREALFAGTVEP